MLLVIMSLLLLLLGALVVDSSKSASSNDPVLITFEYWFLVPWFLACLQYNFQQRKINYFVVQRVILG